MIYEIANMVELLRFLGTAGQPGDRYVPEREEAPADMSHAKPPHNPIRTRNTAWINRRTGERFDLVWRRVEPK